MSDEELALYNEENGTNFELISPEVYEISKFEVSFSPDQKDVNRIINIDFDPAKLAASATNKVLPIKIIDASIDVNKDKSYCIIHPQTYDPQFTLENPQEKIVSYVKGTQSVLSTIFLLHWILIQTYRLSTWNWKLIRILLISIIYPTTKIILFPMQMHSLLSRIKH